VSFELDLSIQKIARIQKSTIETMSFINQKITSILSLTTILYIRYRLIYPQTTQRGLRRRFLRWGIRPPSYGPCDLQDYSPAGTCR